MVTDQLVFQGGVENGAPQLPFPDFLISLMCPGAVRVWGVPVGGYVCMWLPCVLGDVVLPLSLFF